MTENNEIYPEMKSVESRLSLLREAARETKFGTFPKGGRGGSRPNPKVKGSHT